MLPVRQRLLAFEGPEPTPGPWPLQNDVYPPRNSGFKSGSEPWYGLRRRQITSSNPTCGYLDGDPDQPRTADSGFTCRVDTENALWGSCPVSVISASDCGLAAACVDSYACIRGCGTPKTTSLTTFTWYGICVFLSLFWLLTLPVLTFRSSALVLSQTPEH